MKCYDVSALNEREFETLCTDICREHIRNIRLPFSRIIGPQYRDFGQPKTFYFTDRAGRRSAVWKIDYMDVGPCAFVRSHYFIWQSKFLSQDQMSASSLAHLLVEDFEAILENLTQEHCWALTDQNSQPDASVVYTALTNSATPAEDITAAFRRIVKGKYKFNEFIWQFSAKNTIEDSPA